MKIRCTRAHGSGICPDCANTHYVEDPGAHAGRYECITCRGDGAYLSGCDGLVQCDDCGNTGLTHRPQKCYSCRGSSDCPDCEGSGEVTRVRGNCKACTGTGIADGKPCAACGGERWVAGDLRLYQCNYCGVVSSEPVVRSCPVCRQYLHHLMSGKLLLR